MSAPFTLAPGAGLYVVRAGGAVIGESRAVLVMDEPGYERVVYFPREDIGMAFLDPSDTRTTCPTKGEARYFHIVAKSGRIGDAGWSYERPVPGAEPIAGHIAFAHERVTVERV